MTGTHDQTTTAALLAEATARLRRKDIDGMGESLRQLSLPACSGSVRFEAATLFGAAGATSDAIGWFLQAGAAFIDPEADLGRAREAFKQALALDPQNLDIEFEIGRIDMIDGNPQHALAHFVHVLRKSKYSHVRALFETACIYEQLGLHDQAVLTFRKVLDRDKSNVQAIINMGQRLQKMGMLPDAVGYFMQAAGTAHAAGQTGTCRHVVNLVIGLDPNNQHARRMLAELDDRLSTAPELPVEVVPPLDDVSAMPKSVVAAGAAADSELGKLNARSDRLRRKVSELSAAIAKLEETVAVLSAEVDSLRAAKMADVKTREAPKKAAPKRKARTPRS